MNARGSLGPMLLLLLLTVAVTLSLLMAGSFASLLSLPQPYEEWNRTLGGPYGDGVWSAQMTDDGGYLLVGYTSARGEGSDLWLVKVDSDGRDIWNRIFGGSGEDVGYFVQNTRDGGSVLTGSTKSYGMGEERLWLLKADSNGSKQWDRIFGGFVSSAGDGGWSVNETNDGGYIVTGYTKSFGAGGKDLWLIKTDSEGFKQWDKTFGGSKDDVGMSVIQAADGGFVVAGRTASYGSGKDDIWVLKTDLEGRELWNRTFGGAEDDVGFQVLDIDEGYAIVGRTESGREGKRAILLKTDLRGVEKWEKTYQKGSSGISVQRSSDGGFLISGSIDSSKAGKDAILIKTDIAGREEWTLPLGGTGADTGCFALEGRDGGYLLAGITDSFGSGAEDAWLIKLRPSDINKNATAIDLTIANATVTNNTADNNIEANRTATNNTTTNLIAQNQNIFKQKNQLFSDVFSDKGLGHKPLPPMPSADLLRRSGQSA